MKLNIAKRWKSNLFLIITVAEPYRNWFIHIFPIYSINAPN